MKNAWCYEDIVLMHYFGSVKKNISIKITLAVSVILLLATFKSLPLNMWVIVAGTILIYCVSLIRKIVANESKRLKKEEDDYAFRALSSILSRQERYLLSGYDNSIEKGEYLRALQLLLILQGIIISKLEKIRAAEEHTVAYSAINRLIAETYMEVADLNYKEVFGRAELIQAFDLMVKEN